MALIAGMKPQDLMTRYALPRWLASHQEWLEQFPEARHVVTTNSGHEVVLSDPLLVSETIRDVVEEVRRH